MTVSFDYLNAPAARLESRYPRCHKFISVAISVRRYRHYRISGPMGHPQLNQPRD
jgi:hypothetical protein